MNIIKIGDLELGKIPKIVAIIDRMLSLEKIDALKKNGVDIFEIRFDCFSGNFVEILDYLEKLRTHIDTPLIGTIRETDTNRENRFDMFKKIIPFVDAIDIEIDADINKAVIEYAENTVIIVSEHDYEKTPDNNSLETIVEIAMKQGAHIVKIAAMAKVIEDVARLMIFVSDRQEPVVAISMGETGKLSRVAAPLFGSLFTYAFVNESVAPGQISLEEMVEEIKKYYPGK